MFAGAKKSLEVSSADMVADLVEWSILTLDAPGDILVAHASHRKPELDLKQRRV